MSDVRKVSNCIFCKISNGEIRAKKIFETENAISFLDINPRAPGHSLVIPKKHVITLAELEDKLIVEVFKMTREVVKMLKITLSPDAFSIGINDGKASGQEIPHLHVNIFPRFRDDGGKTVHSIVNNPPSDKISEISEKIKRNTSR